MQVDINQSKSRSFNLSIRFLQLAISLLIAIYVNNLDSSNCQNSFSSFILALGYILVAVNLIAILVYRCRQNFSKVSFYLFSSANLILAGIVLIVSFAGYGQEGVCAANKMMYKFAIAEVCFIVIMALLVLFAPFYWVQRYSNSPGNIAWVVLFLGGSWSPSFSSLTTLGVISLLISLGTIFSNSIAAWKGVTSTTKKLIVATWFICLLMMATNQIIAVISYFSNSDLNGYTDVMGKKLLQTFMAVNILQICLWVFGLLSLKHEDGDPIRESLLSFGKKESDENEHEEEEQRGGGFGTIR